MKKPAMETQTWARSFSMSYNTKKEKKVMRIKDTQVLNVLKMKVTAYYTCTPVLFDVLQHNK